MSRTYQKVYDMLCRVKQFLNDHAAALGQITQSAASHELDTLLTAMGSSAEVAVTSRAMAAGASANTRALRRVLWTNHMQPIAAVARAELQDVPQFESLLLPRVNESTPRLVLRARAMAAVAREHVDVFLAHQLTADFAERLLGAADAVDVSVQQRATDARDAAGARDQLAQVRSRAQYVIRVLNAQVQVALADNSTLLGQWKFAKRVGIHPAVAAVESTTGQTATPQLVGTSAMTPSSTTDTAPLAVAGQQQQVAQAA